MSDFIPWDVFPDILINLPPKDLFKCTCVCKEWQCLITNPTFIKTHLLRHYNNNNNNNSDLLLVRSCRVTKRIEREGYCDEQVQEIYSLHCEVGNKLPKYAEIDFPFERANNYHYRIVDSCNGVICLSDDLRSINNTIILWNPTVKKSIKLPKYRVTDESHGPFKHILGFGFDPKTFDYKVVRIVELQHGVPFEVDIYSSGTGNWRNISHSALNLSCHMKNRNPQTIFNGSLHWVLSHVPGKRKFILSFDLSDEVFNCIGLPTTIDIQLDRDRHGGVNRAPWVLKLAVIGGSFCVVQRYIGRYCIWMMKEYGVTSSWTKILNADFRQRVDQVVGFRNSGKLLVEIRRNLFTFVPDNLSLTELGINRDNEGCRRHSFQAVSHVESLGLVGNTHVENSKDDEDRGGAKRGCEGLQPSSYY